MPGNKGIWVGICCEFVEFLVLFIVYSPSPARTFPTPSTPGRSGSQNGRRGDHLVDGEQQLFIACSVARLRTGRRRESIAWLIAGLIVALGYPVAKYLEIQWNLAHGIDGESGIFFTVYYYLTFTHMVHAFWGILGILWVLARHGFGIYTADEHSGLEALASYWHATDIIWLVIFPFFYVLA